MQNDQKDLGVSITEDAEGNIAIFTRTGTADAVKVLVDGEEIVNESNISPGDTLSVSDVPGSTLTIIEVDGGSESVVQFYRVQHGTDGAESGVVFSEPSATPGTVSASDLAGSGTKSDPYVITTDQELQAMNSDLNASYVLGTNIDASKTGQWNSGAGFDPVGVLFDEFNGSFDGQRYVVDGLTINRSTTNYVGLFGLTTSGSSVSDVELINIDITGDSIVGGLVGFNRGSISSSYATGSVRSANGASGGLVGFNRGSISSSYATGSVSGDSDLGGLVGRNDGSISSSYATGSVSGDFEDIGGLVGDNEGSISNSYATGSVSGDLDVGGLVGDNSGSISSSYWDTVSSEQDTSDGDGGTGLSTSDMQGDSYDSGFESNIVNNPSFIGVTGDYPELVWESE
jgi:hypothetical protein